MNRRLLLIFLFLGVFVIYCSSCSVKEDLHKTSHPGYSELTLRTEWNDHSAASAAEVPPLSYQAEVDRVKEIVYSTEFVFPTLIAPGLHIVRAYSHEPEYIDLAWPVAQVYGAGTPSMSQSPGYLFSGCEPNFLAVADRKQQVTLSMRQEVGDLVFTLVPRGNVAGISNVSGTLSNVAGKLELYTREHSVATEIPLDFEQEGDKLVARTRILGFIDGFSDEDVPVLTLSVTQTGADLPSVTRQTLTGLREAFNANKAGDHSYNANADVPFQAGFEVAITPWTPNAEGPVDIEEIHP